MSLKLLFSLFYAITITACQALPKEIPVQAPPQRKPAVFKVTLPPQGGFILNFVDSNFKHEELEFGNRKDSIYTLFKSVSIQLPTEFSYVTFKGYVFDTRYNMLVFPGDTIHIVVDRSQITMRSNNTTTMYLNNLFRPIPFKAFNDGERPFKNNATVVAGLRKKRAIIADSIELLAKLHQLPSAYTQVFLRYNNLRHYGEVFNMNYNMYDAEYAADLKWLQSLQDSIHNDSVVHTISSVEVNMLLYDLWQLGKAANNIKNGTPLDNIGYIDQRFYKTKAITGLLLTYVDLESHTILEKEKSLAKIMPYIDTMMLAQVRKVTTAPLGDSVLAIMLKDLAGRTISLKELLSRNSKRLIVLDFWASWCVPCIGQLPALKKLEKKYNQEMEVISISIDKEPGKWLEACKKHNIQHNAYHIANPKTNPLIQHFAISSIPRYIVLDNRGNLISDDFYRPSDPKFAISIQEIHRGLQ